MDTNFETALFALGSFLEPQDVFATLPGIIETTVGYTGGTSGRPTHHDTGDYAEAIKIDYDPRKITYEELLETFWDLHDPTAEYEPRFRSAIFYLDETQRELAEASRDRQQGHYNDPITTEVIPASKFYPAEENQQHYLAKQRGEW